MTLTLDRVLLGQIAIFKGLDGAAMAHVLSMARYRDFAPGDTAFMQDEESRALFVLLSGRMKLTQLTAEGHQVVLHFVGPGEMFGCAAVCGGFAYPGTATAVKQSKAAIWTRADMESLMEEFPPIARQRDAGHGRAHARGADTHARTGDRAR